MQIGSAAKEVLITHAHTKTEHITTVLPSSGIVVQDSQQKPILTAYIAS